MAKEKKEYKNLFDAVSEIESKKAAENLDSKNNQDDLQISLNHCESMHEEISVGLEHAFRFNDLTPSQFRAYLSRPQNFSKQEWELIQKEKRLNNERIQALISKIQSVSQSASTQNDTHRDIQAESGEKQEHEKEIDDVFDDTDTLSHTVTKSDIESQTETLVTKDTKKKKQISKRNWISMH